MFRLVHRKIILPTKTYTVPAEGRILTDLPLNTFYNAYRLPAWAHFVYYLEFLHFLRNIINFFLVLSSESLHIEDNKKAKRNFTLYQQEGF